MPPVNLAVLCGTLSKAPELRFLADGRTVWELDLTVRQDGRSTTTVPVSWAAPPAATPPGRWSPGEEVVVVGTVRRRFYRAGGATVSRTDVLADGVIPARQRKRAAALLADAISALHLAETCSARALRSSIPRHG